MSLLYRVCVVALAVPLMALFPAGEGTAEPDPRTPHVGALKITVLSTMLGGDAHRGLGEWGYAALVEVDGKRLLFDTGGRAALVLHNARP